LVVVMTERTSEG